MADEGDAQLTRAAAADAARAALDRPVASVQPFEEGENAVYRVRFDDGTDAVLKAGTAQEGPRLLSGPLLIDRIAGETHVPVPGILATVPAGDGPIDPAYYLMEFVEGRRTPDVGDLSPAAHERLAAEAGRHLAAIHDISGDWPYGRLVANDGELMTTHGVDDWTEGFHGEVEYLFEGVADRFCDLEPTLRAAFDEFDDAVADRTVDRSVLYRDYHAKNTVFAPRDEVDRDGNSQSDARVTRALLDFNFRLVGDAPLDVAIAEWTLVDVPLGGTDGAERVRATLRDAYVEARGGTHADHFDATYPCYRLVPVFNHLRYFGYFSQFAREDDPDAFAARIREFVRARRDEIGDCGAL